MSVTLKSLKTKITKNYIVRNSDYHSTRVSRASVKQTFRDLIKSDFAQVGTKENCLICDKKNESGSLEVSKESEGRLRVGCSILPKKLVEEIGKWAFGE